ncbi:hypothetical protein [Paenibacillus sp. GM2]|uniref:hypothetical protein n=1 Tax=Paenibacillus sp. GM2 TaxID=1622070 RepID=UPI000B1187D6|nr:hypothetical protein [Paenibacillus sp. GM2]
MSEVVRGYCYYDEYALQEGFDGWVRGSHKVWQQYRIATKYYVIVAVKRYGD